MPDITQVRARPKEILAKLSPDTYRAAYGKGMSLSAYLEREDPSEDWGEEGRSLDAFDRCMKAAGIRSRSNMERGVYASSYEDFMATDQTRSLVPEWVARQWRQVAFSTQRAAATGTFQSNDAAVGTIQNPYVDAAQVRVRQVAPAIPLAELIAINTPISGGDAYRAFYLQTDDQDYEHFVRVGEGAEVPRSKITGGDQVVRTHKYGRALEMTYEQMRRMRIDMVALFVQRMAVAAETDKLATALDVAINGDGNASTAATTYNLTSLDAAAVSGTLSLKGWLAFKLKFTNPYALSHALMPEAMALQLLNLSTGTANWPLVDVQAASGFGGVTIINPELGRSVRIGWTSAAPANKIVGYDRQWALERVFEVGANITEVERFVLNQRQVLVMTEVEGYKVFDQFATKILIVNA
jgi:hypothetical protein